MCVIDVRFNAIFVQNSHLLFENKNTGICVDSVLD